MAKTLKSFEKYLKGIVSLSKGDKYEDYKY
jgi:hypothetical protein